MFKRKEGLFSSMVSKLTFFNREFIYYVLCWSEKFIFMLHAPYSLTDIVGKALLWASSVCWDASNTSFIWDILAKP